MSGVHVAEYPATLPPFVWGPSISETITYDKSVEAGVASLVEAYESLGRDVTVVGFSQSGRA